MNKLPLHVRDQIDLLKKQCKAYLVMNEVVTDESAKLTYLESATKCVQLAWEIHNKALRTYCESDETILIEVA